MQKNRSTYVQNIVLPCLLFSAIAGIFTGILIFLFKFVASHVISLSGEIYEHVRENPSLLPILILGAAVLELKDFNEISVGSVELVNYIVGMVVAAVVGYICIRWLLVLVKNKKFKYFSIYCFAVGIIAIVAHFVI